MTAEGVAAIPLRWRSAVALAVLSAVGLVAFCWPLVLPPEAAAAGQAHTADAPWILVVVLPLLLAVILTELADGSLDAKAVALLGVLAACGAVLRLPGMSGFEPLFFLLVPAGRVLGRGFGFVLGALTLFASALITAGVGPWLPFQMLAAGWVGFGAGCLPALRGRAELVMIAAYGAVAGLAYGLVMNLWFWPFTLGPGTEVSFLPGAPIGENLRRFWGFHVTTSLGFDLPRALTTATLVLLAGAPVLAALRRAARRAAFGAPVRFEPRPDRVEPARIR